MKEIQTLSDEIEGFLTQNGATGREGEVLFHLARKAPFKGVIVEIGSWQGKSTIWLGKGCEKKAGTLYAIDHHVGSAEHTQHGNKVWTFDAFTRNIAKAQLTKYVKPILKNSKEACPLVQEPLDVLFIDGAHEKEAVQEDFDLWQGKLKEGGTIAFHDSFTKGWPGVRSVVHKNIFKSGSFCKVRYINSITYATKTVRATFSQRVENHLVLFIKCFHEASLRFPQPLKSFAKRLVWLPFKKKWLRELNR